MLFRKKPIQCVHRVEDLQVGDVIQLDLINRGCVHEIHQVNKNYIDLRMETLDQNGRPHENTRVALHRDLKIFVWR
jgi:Tfp pilus assembly ATPase PilU